MKIYQESPAPLIRSGEFDLAGRRVAARAFPYAGEAGPRWRFDPVDRRFVSTASSGSVGVGPYDSEAWRRAVSRASAGSVLVGPCDSAEEVRGAYEAAVEGAAACGRGVYLLDPPASLAAREASECFVPVFVLLPEDPMPEAMKRASAAGFSGGCLFPLIPGWTTEPRAIVSAVRRAAQAGAAFVAGLSVSDDGVDRRTIVQAREELSPENLPDDFFDRIHHGDWKSAVDQARLAIETACAAHGIASLPARPVGRGQPAGNARTAARLEEAAEALGARDEHRAALYHAAARWIDESSRDLAVIVAEGNFRKIFPLDDETSQAAEEALRGADACRSS